MRANLNQHYFTHHSIKKLVASVILLLMCNMLSFAQNRNELTINQRQDRINLDAAKGFGNFVFGSPLKLYKNFKFIQDNNEPSKRYFSKIPINTNGIQIDSVYLDFYKNRLYCITMYIKKSSLKDFKAYCTKKYGPLGMDLDENGAALWRGKIKQINLYELANGTSEILFIDNSNINDRIGSLDDLN